MTPHPTDIKYHQQSRVLDIAFDSGETFNLACEYLRVFSPSAEVRGHAPGQEVLQVGKQEVGIDEIHPVGNYAVVLRFSDGHDTGIYSWDYFYYLGKNHDTLWPQYLERMDKAGKSRDPKDCPPEPMKKEGGCGGGGSKCSH